VIKYNIGTNKRLSLCDGCLGRIANEIKESQVTNWRLHDLLDSVLSSMDRKCHQLKWFHALLFDLNTKHFNFIVIFSLSSNPINSSKTISILLITSLSKEQIHFDKCGEIYWVSWLCANVNLFQCENRCPALGLVKNKN
jgi:hypothetical protein